MEIPEHVNQVTCSGNELRCAGTKELLACHSCEYRCSEETSMILHLVHHHDFTTTSSDSQVTGFLYEGDHYCCQACAFLSPSRLMFQEHIRCHTFASPYTCAACNQPVRLKHVIAHYHTRHSNTLAPAIRVASSTLVDEIMQKLGPSAPFSISEIPISPQLLTAVASPRPAKDGDVVRPDSSNLASPDSSERSEEPLPSTLGLTDCQLLQVLVTNCNYKDGAFVCGLCRFSTQCLPVILKHLHADVQRWNCNCVGCRSSNFSNCIVITAAMTKLKKKQLQVVGKDKMPARAVPASPKVIAAVNSDPEVNQNNAAGISSRPSTSEETSQVSSSTPCYKEGKKVQTVKLLCDLVDDTYVCKSCKFYEKDAAVFRKHLWDDIHQSGDCTHNGLNVTSSVDNNKCTILNSLMQMLLIRRNDMDRHKGAEQCGNSRVSVAEGTDDVHVETSHEEGSSGSETTEHVQQPEAADGEDTSNKDVSVSAVSSDNGLKADSGESEFFRCGFVNCRSSFSAVLGLKKHILSAHKSMKVYPCPYCSCLWPDYNHLLEHIPAHSGPTPYRCVQCDVCFENMAQLRNHLNKMHKVNKLFKCTFDGCDYVSNIWTEFKMHNFTFHPNESSYVCFACRTRMTDLSAYFWHIESGLVTLICCSYCPMKSKMRHTILRHSNSVHQGLDLKVTVQTEVKCATEPDSTQLTAYHKNPSNEQLVIYTCDTCDFASDDKPTVVEHVKYHESDTNHQFAFVCSHCPFGTAGLQCFNAHVADHRRLTTHHFRYYKCTHCLYTSNQMALIEKHLQERHAHKLFKFEVQQEIVTGKGKLSGSRRVVVKGKVARTATLKELLTSKCTQTALQKESMKSKGTDPEIQNDAVTSKNSQPEVLKERCIQSEVQKGPLTSNVVPSGLKKHVSSKNSQPEVLKERGTQSGVQKGPLTSNVVPSGLKKHVSSKNSQPKVLKERGIQPEVQKGPLTSNVVPSGLKKHVSSKRNDTGEQQEVMQDRDTPSKVQQQKVMVTTGSNANVHICVKDKHRKAVVQRKHLTGKGSKSKVQKVVGGSRSRSKALMKYTKGKRSSKSTKSVTSTTGGIVLKRRLVILLERCDAPTSNITRKEVTEGCDVPSDIVPRKGVTRGRDVPSDSVSRKGVTGSRDVPSDTVPRKEVTGSRDVPSDTVPRKEVTGSRDVPNDTVPRKEVTGSRDVPSDTVPRKEVTGSRDVPSDTVPRKEVTGSRDVPSDTVPRKEVTGNHDVPSDTVPRKEVTASRDVPSDTVPRKEVTGSRDVPSDTVPRKEVTGSRDVPSDTVPRKEVTESRDITTDAMPRTEIQDSVPTKEATGRCDVSTDNVVTEKRDVSSDIVSRKKVTGRGDNPTDSVPRKEVTGRCDNPTDSVPRKEVTGRGDNPTDSVPRKELTERSEVPNDSVSRKELTETCGVPCDSMSSKEVTERCDLPCDSVPRKEVTETCGVPCDSVPRKEVTETRGVPSDSVLGSEVRIKKEVVDEELLPVIQSVKTEIVDDSPAQENLARDSTAIERFHCDLCEFSCCDWSRLHEHIKAAHGNVTQWNNVSMSVTTAANMASPKPPHIRPGESAASDAEERVDEVAEAMRYHCNLCPFVCELWKTFQVHMADNHSYRAIKVDMTLPYQNIMAVPIEKPKPVVSKTQGQFVCDKCPFTTDVISNFRRHKKAHSKNLKSGFRCMYCSYSSFHKFVITRHVKNYHTDKPLDEPHVVSLQTQKTPTTSMADEQTRVCTRQAKSNLAVQSSVTSEPPAVEQDPDTQSDTQSQESCDEHDDDDDDNSSTTMESSTYCTHLDNQDLYQCKQCEFVNRYPSKVRRHSDYCHTKHCPYKCGYCEFRSVESGKVKRHCGSAHRDQPAKVIKIDFDAKTSQPVSVLMSESQKNDDIETEEEEEDGERTNEGSQWYWRKFVKTSDNQMMSCRRCGYRQVGASALKRHVLSIHLGFSPFACKYCSFATTEIRYVKLHIEKTHPGLACKVIRRRYVSESTGEIDDELHDSDPAIGVTVGRAMSTTTLCDKEAQGAWSTGTCGDSTTPLTETGKGHHPCVDRPVKTEPSATTPPNQKQQGRHYKCIYCDFYSDDRFIFDIRDHIFVAHLHRDHYMCAHCGFGSMKRDEIVAHNQNKHPDKDNIVKEDKTYSRNIAVLETHGNMRMVGVRSDDKLPLELLSPGRKEKLLCTRPLVSGSASESELVTNNVALNDVANTDPHNPCAQNIVITNTHSLCSDNSQTVTPTLPTRSKDKQVSAEQESDTRGPSPSTSVSSLRLDNATDAHRSNVLSSSAQQTPESEVDSQRLVSPGAQGDDGRLGSTNFIQMLPSEESSSQRSASPSSYTTNGSGGRHSTGNDIAALANEESGLQRSVSPFRSTRQCRERTRSSIPRVPNDDSDSQRSTSSFSSTKRNSNRTRSCTSHVPDDSDSQRSVSPACSTKPTSNRIRRSVPNLPKDESNSQRSSNPSVPTIKRRPGRPSKTNGITKMPNEDSDSQESTASSTKRGSDRLRGLTPKVPKEGCDSHRSTSSTRSLLKGDHHSRRSARSARKMAMADSDSHRSTSSTGSLPKDDSDSHRSTSSTKKLPAVDIDVKRNKSCFSPLSSPVKRESDVKVAAVIRKKLKLRRRTDDSCDAAKKALKADAADPVRDSADPLVSWKCKKCGLDLAKLEKMRRHILMHHMEMRPYQCAVCDYADKKVKLVEEHIRDKHVKSRIHIPVVNMMDEMSDSLRKQMIMIKSKSVETKRLRTSRRKDSKFDYNTLRATDAKGDSLYRCDLCDHQVRVKASIIKHRKTHFKYHPLGCGYCDYRTSNSFFLECHNNNVHAGRPLKTRMISRSKADDSNGGDEKEESKEKKVSSRKRRHSASPVKPRTTDKVGDEDDGLEPTFMCQTCGKKMLLKSSMERHVMVEHLGYRPYSCSGCDYAAVNKSTVQAHIAKKHEIASCWIVYKKDDHHEAMVQSTVVRAADTREPTLPSLFVCTVCKAFKTSSRARIESHISDEVKYAPHQCGYCLFSSSRREAVRVHLLEAHPQEKLVYKFCERFILKQRVQDLIEQSIVSTESDAEADFDVYNFTENAPQDKTGV